MGGALVGGFAAVIEIILNMIQFLVIASIVIGWVGGDTSKPLVQLVINITEPMYRPFRVLTRKIPGPIDWAPMCILLIIVFIQRGFLPYLRIVAHNTPAG